MKIAFQGVPGANSEVGIRQHYGPEAEPIPCDFSEQVFEAVLSGRAQYGFVPVENSIAGNVAINMDLLFRQPVAVIAEDYVFIQHCLLALPGVKLNDIKRVYSHPVALAQCRPFIRQFNLTAIPDFDTAGAARALAERGHKDEGAIAPSLCTEYYPVEILRTHIQEVRQNITRFLTFVRSEMVPKDLPREKTSMAFQTRHSSGALVACLQLFSKYDINMTRLESRPVPDNPFVYTFFVDFMGSPLEPRVQQCLAEMSLNTSLIKFLGSYAVDRDHQFHRLEPEDLAALDALNTGPESE